MPDIDPHLTFKSIKMRKSMFLIILSMCTRIVYSQTTPVQLQFFEIGKPCPPFSFDDIEYFSKNQASSNDFKGKWLVLDCWNRWCADCITAMPHTDSLQRKFKSQAQFLLVGYTGSKYTETQGPDDKHIRLLYEKLRKKENLDLPVAFDSTLFAQFDISGCPHIVVIDPKGIVRAVTYELTQGNLQDFINGKLLVSCHKYYDG